MSQGAKAMVAAKANSLLGKEWGAKQQTAHLAGVSPGFLSQAVAVLEYRPDLADSVVAGGSLKDA